jgi:hypothetical protein
VADVDDSALTPRRDALTQYVIYDHPRDHPEHFVVRPWDIQAGGAVAREAAGLFRDLDKARAYCAQFGLVCIGRQDGDDPTIVETWT